MTPLLQQAVAVLATRPDFEQDEIAARILADLAAEDAFDAKIAATAHLLPGLFAEAMAEHDAGLTEELVIPDGDELRPEYVFDYAKAEPNRFASPRRGAEES